MDHRQTAKTRQGQTAGRSAKTFGPGAQILALSQYTPIVGKATEQNIYGGLFPMSTGDPLDSVPTDITFTMGLGQLMFVVNAGSDTSGTLTITGTSVDAKTGVETAADTEDLVIAGLTTDNSDTDANGNIRHSFTDAYISTKLFKDAITVSTTDLTLTDVDSFQSSHSKLGGGGAFLVTGFQTSFLAANASAQLDTYLYAVESTLGNKVNYRRISELNSGATSNGLVYELTRGDIGELLPGKDDGIFIDLFASGNNHIEELTVSLVVLIPGGTSGLVSLTLKGVQTAAATVIDESIVRYDGTTGELIQGSFSTLADDGDLTLSDGAGNTTEVRVSSTVPAVFFNNQVVMFLNEATLDLIIRSRSGAGSAVTVQPNVTGGTGTINLTNFQTGETTTVNVGTDAAGGTGIINADSLTAIRTNGDLTLAGKGTGSVVADGVDIAAHDHSSSSGQTRLAAKDRTITKIVYIESPTATDSFPIAFIADAVTLIQVRGVTDTGTVDFNIEHRATDTPDVAGTNTLTSDLQATSSGASSTSFSDATVPAERWLNYNASAIASSPTKLWVVVEYTID